MHECRKRLRLQRRSQADPQHAKQGYGSCGHFERRVTVINRVLGRRAEQAPLVRLVEADHWLRGRAASEAPAVAPNARQASR
eukprot:scaffold242842_cov30-Tisochrysis_lutea.AAC.1